jgi:hypothetical protein
MTIEQLATAERALALAQAQVVRSPWIKFWKKK